MSPSASSPINLTNQFLIAMPGMVDGNFAGTVVYLCEHNDKGALGLVINRPIDINLKHLFEKVDLSLDRSDLAERPVYLGGPVQTERGFVLHESLDDEGGHYNSTLKIEGGLEMTTSRDVLEALSQRGRAAQGVHHPGLLRLDGGAARRGNLAQRLAERRCRSGCDFRHPHGAALRQGLVAVGHYPQLPDG
jgi:putative AlgH/UPF0301 family transcriptional regulator